MIKNTKMFNTLKLSKKNKKYIFIIILSIIFIFIFVKKPKNIFDMSSKALSNDPNIYTHQSNEVTMNIYNTKIKKFRFKLIAQHIQYFSNKKIAQFIQPKITIFNEKNVAIWQITSNQATLNNKQKILYLQGYIYINNLSQNTYFSSILSNQLKINLINNDILSNTTVILHGHYFYSIGTQMHGNLYTKKMQLINNTQTYYEIQNIK